MKLLPLLLATGSLAAMTPRQEVIATVVMEASNSRQEMHAIVNVVWNRARAAGITPLEAVQGKVYGPFYGYSRREEAKTKMFWRRWSTVEAYVDLVEQGRLPDITNGALFFDKKFTWGKKIGTQFFSKYFQKSS